MFGKRRFTQAGLALLVSGACACSQQKAQGVDFDPSGYDGFTETHIDALTAACSYASGTMTLTVGDTETAYLFLRSADGLVVANASYAGGDCTASPTSQIIINGGTGAQTVLLDYNFGTFGLGSISGPGIVIDLGAGTSDLLEIRGSPAADTITFGTNGAGLSLAAIQVAPAKARTVPDISFANVEQVKVSAGAGNDVITGQGGAAVGGTTKVPVGPLSGTISMTLYGGEGNDTLTSGDVPGGVGNSLNGGPDNDLFLQQAALASDDIVGGDGVDTVDYSVRSNPVNVSLGGTAARGSVTFPVKSLIANNDTLTIGTKVFEYKAVSNSAATGSISITNAAPVADGDTIEIKNHAGIVLHTLEYDIANDGVVGTNIPIVPSAPLDTDPNDLAAATVAAINLAGNNIAEIHAGTPTGAPTGPIVIPVTGLAPTYAVGDTFLASNLVSFTTVNMAGGSFFVATGDVTIDISALAGSATAPQVAAASYAVLSSTHGAGFPITAVDPGATAKVTLISDTLNGADVTITPSNAAFTPIVSMTTTGVYDDGEAGENDNIHGDVENVVGGSGADTINASLATALPHVLMGMSGNDTLIGATTVDYLYGGPGNDILMGGDNADVLRGGDGNDTLQGGKGDDTLDGAGVNCVAAVSALVPWVSPACTTAFAKAGTAASNDIVDYSDHIAGVSVDLASVANLTCSTPMGSAGECDYLVGTTTGTGSSAVTLANVRSIIGSAYADHLYGDAKDNEIWGGDGDDIIWGRAGNDFLYGQGGSDHIYGNDAADTALLTQTDNDYISGGAGDNFLYGQEGANTIDTSQCDGSQGDTVVCGSGTANILLRGAVPVKSESGCIWQ